MTTPRPTNPIRGDVHLLEDYPPDTPLYKITEFEIWDGERWISAAEAKDIEFDMWQQ
jgi:hypothetical protein